ncbi:hypothetical protein N7532_008808 [Penicillium argentinense]|uniref:Cytochrome P450 n=1 Tax=Penicillium argentinense TaxID=1131581 RepID=A0A9W9EY45_9EURO|nr:uncharacterized protein N7532_008808 [Penicillium argentinense]KAJ5090124.1 hypothetical protein N7532_008808 [Penicillium argentinense]
MGPFTYSAMGVALGLALHHGLLIHGEWHIRAPDLLIYHVVCFASLLTLLESAPSMILGYIASLFSSIIVYRVFFHRLRQFPGPKLACVTKLWHAWHARHRQNYLVLGKLHETYGDFIRTGPSEVTVYHPDVFMAIDGPQGNCVKSDWYDLLHPKQSLVTARKKEVHAGRRRQWNRGFTSQALDQYQDRILPLLDELDGCIEADIAAGRPSNARNLFFWLGFDRMGDFIFSRTFNMLSRQEWHHIILLLQRALSLLGPLSPVPWLIHIAFKLLPRIWILNDWFRMVAWCESQMVNRLKTHADTGKARDVAHYLLEDVKEDYQQFPWLTGDGILAIVAGSEPTAAVLTGLFYELAKHPEHAEEILREISCIDIHDSRALAQRCPHLEAVILEALRLYPALPTGGNRKTLENGVVIGGRYIPPDTTIVAPRFCISRREDCFEKALEFIPERWYKHPEMVWNKAAFAPFGTGHHSCLGRALAMNDMRLTTARLIQKYTFTFPAGENGDSVWKDLKDQFTSNPGCLRLVFERRQA